MSRPAAPALVVLGAWGAGLLTAPGRLAGLVGGPPPPAAIVRVLGARRLVQELALLRWPSPGVAVAAAAVDGLHAASMLAAAGLWPRYRRAALTSAGVAAGSAVLSLVTAAPPR